jgi:3-methyladenine DNA glycosylase AlkD
MPTKKSKKQAKAAATKAPKPKTPAARLGLTEAMAALEKAGSAQARKTYARHGAAEPMFGVSFAVLKTLVKRIGLDHELAGALWSTGNFDARNLAVKVADPARMSPAALSRWAREARMPMLLDYVAQLASEGPHAAALAAKWSASSDPAESCAAWPLLAQMAFRDETTPDAWFEGRLAEIERAIHSAPNAHREAMNQTLIAIGCRSAALRKAATAAAKRIGKVEVDRGDTACKTPDAASYIEKTWAHSTSKGFPSPAAHERSREPMRMRC